jgi:hypothetical protein
LRHSSLRNVIERIFGVLKKQWQIVGGKGYEYSIQTQVALFCCVIGLYNFRKQHGEVDIFESDSWIDDDIDNIDEDVSNSVGENRTTGAKIIEKKRDEIADKM